MWWTLSVTNENLLRPTLVLFVISLKCSRTTRDSCCYRLFHLKDDREMSRDKCIQTMNWGFTMCEQAAMLWQASSLDVIKIFTTATWYPRYLADPRILIRKVHAISWQKVSQININSCVQIAHIRACTLDNCGAMEQLLSQIIRQSRNHQQKWTKSTAHMWYFGLHNTRHFYLRYLS